MTAAESRPLLRRLLLWGVPAAALAAGLVYYVVGGRYVETDNAYLKADLVAIYPEVEAPVAEVLVTENMDVKSGQPLVRLEGADFDFAARRAEARLAALRGEIAALGRQYEQQLRERSAAVEQVEYCERELARLRGLVAAHLVPSERFDEAEHALRQARVRREVIEQGIAEIRTRLGPALGGNVDAHPRTREALAELGQARLQLDRTTLRAPVAGRIVHVPERGAMARKAAPLLTLVGSRRIWVEANFKETQLTALRVGQRANIELDSYPGAIWRGHVETISPASGSEFAVLPPQNASGNWVKVVQRVPVRIAIDDGPAELQLRAGTSATVAVDTGTRPRLARLERLF
ncbi:MAG: HlyD family secretion protein [Steroidobacteraceae bacterium]